MAVQFYLESADRPSQSGVANEQITPGELVVDDGTGVNAFTFSDGDYGGLALYDPEWLSAEDEDAIANGYYATGDRVRYHPSEDAAVAKVRTIADDGDDAAPSISHGTIVGVCDDSDTNAPDSAAGRIVEEGYAQDDTDDGTANGTTFSRANNNFLAVGRAYRPAKQAGDTVTAFDEPVRVVLFGEAKA